MAYNYLQIQTTAPRKGIEEMTLGQLIDLAPYAMLYEWVDNITEHNYMDSSFCFKNRDREVLEINACKIAERLDGTIYESNLRGVASIKVKLA